MDAYQYFWPSHVEEVIPHPISNWEFFVFIASQHQFIFSIINFTQLILEKSYRYCVLNDIRTIKTDSGQGAAVKNWLNFD